MNKQTKEEFMTDYWQGANHERLCEGKTPVPMEQQALFDAERGNCPCGCNEWVLVFKKG